MNTLVRGQKLPVFSAPGLPGVELAADIVENARPARGEPFAVVFAAIGITERETQLFVSRFRESEVMQRTVLFLNQASDPTIERLLTPRVALTTAEHLAFTHGIHVLVVMADITHYAEALREVAAAREEIPGRRGYPGYMYTDLASLFERAGVLKDGTGSVTQLPVVSLPDGDMTHPIPDLTGYITEGQIVLSRELHQRGVYPPVDVLPSLSRLMNAGIGEGRTVAAHREWADQLYAVYARGREAKLMAAIVGSEGLAPGDRRALDFVDAFERAAHQSEPHAQIHPRHDADRLVAARDAAARRAHANIRRDLGVTSDDGHQRGATAVSVRSVPPTRSGLVRASAQLGRVQKGRELLNRKREALISELFKSARPALNARQEVEDRAAEAYRALLQALGGPRPGRARDVCVAREGGHGRARAQSRSGASPCPRWLHTARSSER